MKIKTRITLSIVCAGLFANIIFSLGLIYELLEQPFRILDTSLYEEANRTVANLLKNGDIEGGRERATDIDAPEAFWIKVYAPASREIIFASYIARQVEIADIGENEKTIIKARVPASLGGAMEKIAFRVRSYRVEYQGDVFIVQIARAMQKFEEEMWEVFWGVIIGLIAATLGLIALGRFLSHKIIGPVGKIKELAEKISTNSLASRIPSGDEQDELSELASTLNRMLDRLQYSFTMQKELLYNTSHEMKTPITTMRLAIEALRVGENELSERDSQTLDSLENQIWRMDRLVKDMLRLSSMEAQNDFQISDVDISDVISSLIDDYKIIANERKLLLSVDIQNHIVIRGDAEKLRRAISNVLDNAVKYSIPNGNIRVRAAKEKGRFTFRVENSADPAVHIDSTKVFEQFYRAEKARTFMPDSGFGLGLSLVKKSVDLHHGQVFFVSSPSGQISLTITLPL